MTLQLSPDGGLPAARPLLLSDVVTPLGDAVAAEAELSVMNWIPSRLAYANRFDEAQNGKIMFSGRGPGRRSAPTSPKLTAAEAQEIAKAEGAGDVEVFEGITRAALAIKIERRKEEQRLQDIIARADKGVGTQFLIGATGFAVDFADPVNLATMAIPGVGEAKAAYFLTRATAKLGPAASKLLVRAGVGAADGAASAAILEPVNYALHRQVGDDYTLTDSLRNVGLGAAGGAALHVLGGTGLDLYRGMRARQGGTAEEFGDAIDITLHQIGQGQPVDVPARRVEGLEGSASVAIQESATGAALEPTVPRPRLADEMSRTIDARLEHLASLSDEELIRFNVGRGGGKRLESDIGSHVHETFRDWVRTHKAGWSSDVKEIANGRLLKPDAKTARDFILELKPYTTSGIRLGRKQAAKYAKGFQTRSRVVYYKYSEDQMLQLKLLKDRIRQLKAKPSLDLPGG